MTLNTDDLILIRTLLEITAVDLEYYIQDTDYSAKYAGEAEAVARADRDYLSDIRAVQTKVTLTVTFWRNDMKKYTATLVVTYKQNVDVEVADDYTPEQLLAQIVDKFDQFGSQVTTTIEDVEELT